MDSLIDELVQKAAIQKGKGNGKMYRLLVQPLVDYGYEFSTVRATAKRMGMSFIQNDTKMCFEAADLKAKITELVHKLKNP